VEKFLRERGLELSAEKTHVTHIQKGFDFLGQNIRKLWKEIVDHACPEERSGGSDKNPGDHREE
jgi:hypothetical protein